ncbi:MAG: SIMPL domain-containing protein [Bacteriovoracaceae bacterium]|nr:SIMPL domain-containing protein [Bacteriovoracaceae bacterium]
MKSPQIISAFIIAMGLALFGFFVRSGIVRFKTLNRVVDVRGLDERIVDSTEASWSVTFVVQANQLGDVYKRSSETEKTIRDYLIDLGFKDEEIVSGVLSTTDLMMNNYSQTKPLFKYSGRMNLTVSSKNVDLVEKAQKSSSVLVAKEIQLEGNYIRYYYSDLNSIKPQMLQAANKSAREAAKSFAKDAGARIGDIEKASQGLFTIDSAMSSEGAESARKKKVRVVTSVSFYLE